MIALFRNVVRQEKCAFIPGLPAWKPLHRLVKANPDGELTLADGLVESVKTSLRLSCKKVQIWGEAEKNHYEERAALLLPEIYSPLYSQLPLIKTKGEERRREGVDDKLAQLSTIIKPKQEISGTTWQRGSCHRAAGCSDWGRYFCSSLNLTHFAATVCIFILCWLKLKWG